MGKTSSKVKDRYNAKAYDRIELKVPKGQKATVQAAAEQKGESINGYVNKAVLGRMGLDEWPDSAASGKDEKEDSAP